MNAFVLYFLLSGQRRSRSVDSLRCQSSARTWSLRAEF